MDDRSRKLKKLYLFFAVCAVLSGCNKNSLSDRDSRLEQLRNQAEIKRKELQTVVGLYEGVIKVEGNDRYVFFDLHIIDRPEYVEGEVDPVLIPVLSGYMNLDKPPEHTPFGIAKSAFDMKEKNLILTLENDTYGILDIKATHGGSGFSGRFSWPKFGYNENFGVELIEEQEGGPE